MHAMRAERQSDTRTGRCVQLQSDALHHPTNQLLSNVHIPDTWAGRLRGRLLRLDADFSLSPDGKEQCIA